jgi:hypothetical protein
MANVLRQTSSEREILARQLFEAGKSPAEVQEALKTKYGFKMNVNKLYTLRKSISSGINTVPTL